MSGILTFTYFQTSKFYGVWKEINLKPPSIKSKNHILINFCETKFG